MEMLEIYVKMNYNESKNNPEKRVRHTLAIISIFLCLNYPATKSCYF